VCVCVCPPAVCVHPRYHPLHSEGGADSAAARDVVGRLASAVTGAADGESRRSGVLALASEELWAEASAALGEGGNGLRHAPLLRAVLAMARGASFAREEKEAGAISFGGYGEGGGGGPVDFTRLALALLAEGRLPHPAPLTPRAQAGRCPRWTPTPPPPACA
jgi:hypothetical protein